MTLEAIYIHCSAYPLYCSLEYNVNVAQFVSCVGTSYWLVFSHLISLSAHDRFIYGIWRKLNGFLPDLAMFMTYACMTDVCFPCKL